MDNKYFTRHDALDQAFAFTFWKSVNKDLVNEWYICQIIEICAPNHPGHDPDHPGQNPHHPNSLGHIGWGAFGKFKG